MEYQDDFVSPSTLGYFSTVLCFCFWWKLSFFLMLSSVFWLDSQRASTTRICGNMRFRFPNQPPFPVPLSWQDLEINRITEPSNLLLCLWTLQIPFCSVSPHFSQDAWLFLYLPEKPPSGRPELRPGTHCSERCHNSFAHKWDASFSRIHHNFFVYTRYHPERMIIILCGFFLFRWAWIFVIFYIWIGSSSLYAWIVK